MGRNAWLVGLERVHLEGASYAKTAFIIRIFSADVKKIIIKGYAFCCKQSVSF